MADLYHIYIFPKPGVEREQVEEMMSLAVDWFRYHKNCYVVETTSDENKWYERLSPLAEKGGHVFICKFDTNHYHGWMSKKFWEWFQGKLKPPAPPVR
ncbi:MAG: hypothetical protein ABSG78_16740 [Verrucomicrobiota bacterium]